MNGLGAHVVVAAAIVARFWKQIVKCYCCCKGSDSDDEWTNQHLETFLQLLHGENNIFMSYLSCC